MFYKQGFYFLSWVVIKFHQYHKPKKKQYKGLCFLLCTLKTALFFYAVNSHLHQKKHVLPCFMNKQWPGLSMTLCKKIKPVLCLFVWKKEQGDGLVGSLSIVESWQSNLFCLSLTVYWICISMLTVASFFSPKKEAMSLKSMKHWKVVVLPCVLTELEDILCMPYLIEMISFTFVWAVLMFVDNYEIHLCCWYQLQCNCVSNRDSIRLKR